MSGPIGGRGTGVVPLQVGIPELPPGTTPTGAETIPADQSGGGVKFTTQQVSGTPLTSIRSLAKNRNRIYTDFSRIRTSGYTATDGGLLDLEPYLVNKSGDATVINGFPVGFAPGLYVTTGTAGTNYITLTDLVGAPLLFDVTKSFEQTISVNVPVLPTAGQAFKVEFGFTSGAMTASPALGLYFAIDQATANWTGYVKNAGGTTPVDTGVVAVAATQVALTVRYDATALATQFYVNGAGPFSITNATRVLAANTGLSRTFAVRKTNGTTSMGVFWANHVADTGVGGALPAGY